ncbi:MAG: hypothetical protein ABI340_10525 [Nitrososphaera sp.]
MELKEILYGAISQYGEHRIVSDIAQGDSSETINALMSHCFTSMEESGDASPEMRSALAEGMLHYLLTVSLIPSQRKTLLGQIEVDIAVPDTNTLSSSPKDAVVIIFPKTSEIKTIQEQIDKIRMIQPNPENIWVVVEDKIPSDVKVYFLKKDNLTFSNIINDLISFTSNKKQSKFKIFRITEN